MKQQPARPADDQVPVRATPPVRGSLVWWLRCLGILALLIVLLRLPSSFEVRLLRVDLRWVGFAMLLTIAQLLLEAWVWQRLLIIQGIRHPYHNTVLVYLASHYLGLVTPGHVGEFLAAGYISMETGITFGYALSSVVMKKVLGWMTVVSFGVWSLDLLEHVPLLQGMQWGFIVAIAILLVLSAGIAVWVVSLRRLAGKWQRFSRWQIDMTEFWSGMRHLQSVRLIVPLGLAVLAFSLLFLQMDAVLHALGIMLPLGFVAKVVAFSRVVARIIPLSAVGFGSKDVAVVSLLSQYGIDQATALASTLLLLLCSYLVTLLLSGLCWWIKPLMIPSAARPAHHRWYRGAHPISKP